MDDNTTGLTMDDLHSSHVDRTLKELQRMVKEHERALAKVRPRTSHRILEGSTVLIASVATDQHTPFLPWSFSVGEGASFRGCCG